MEFIQGRGYGSVGTCNGSEGVEGSVRKFLMILAGVVALVVSMAAPAAADEVYHSQHLDLLPVGGAPLQNGFVENIHANGPQV